MASNAMQAHTRLAFLLVFAFFAVGSAHAGGGVLGLDHLVPLDDRGIWARRNQTLLIGAMMAGEVGAAVWEGGDSRFGRTMWKSIDATVIGGLSSQILKFTFSRARPNQTGSPNQWFRGRGHESFPSGEVTVVSAIVTPVLLEYRHDHPAVYALELLPLYDAIARVKVHGHWQSDVIAGFALGTAVGYFVEKRENTPWVLSVMPQGVYAGFSKRF